jgi:hypothetical protein
MNLPYKSAKALFVQMLLMASLALLPEMMRAQLSVAHRWNEVQLSVIRKDPARPTVQARNLAHISAAMYDAWAAYDDNSEPIFLGNNHGGFAIAFEGIAIPTDVQAAQEMAISYAVYRMLYNRYQNSPQWLTFQKGYCDAYWTELGYNASITSTDYTDGDPAKLGNYIAQQMIAYGLQDGSNQAANYANQFYTDVNPQLFAELPGNPGTGVSGVVDPNRWQRLTLPLNLDQSTGLPLPSGSPALTPEWGNVIPFAMTPDQKTVKNRDGHDWNIYLDPGNPPYIDTTLQTVNYDDDFFKWGYTTNIVWHAMHDPTDGVIVDISPNTIGNVPNSAYPANGDFAGYKDFYDVFEGKDPGTGYTVNPKTGLPYEEQLVKRGDFTRVLSEFWADGPNSETPPGHWFTILNYVSTHPLFEYKWEGQGEVLDPLEFDVRAYVALGGGLLDAAIACWSVKGYYDYTRPIMAIRYMCEKGQSSDENLPSYHPAGIPLLPGFIELIETGDPLAGVNDVNVGKIKLYTWKGPYGDMNTGAGTGENGVGWKLGEEWWTYQRHTFVTPPFPGFISGHSTYSRTAAEIMTLITGDEYFPGGYGEFHAPANTYLGAETGPTQDIYLQWAKYKDASDQCSMSRIFGGLHPPQDDIPGRLMGAVLGPQAFDYANSFMNSSVPKVVSIEVNDRSINESNAGGLLTYTITFSEPMDPLYEPLINFIADDALDASLTFDNAMWPNDSTFVVSYNVIDADENLSNVVIQVSAGQDMEANVQLPSLSEVVVIDTQAPFVMSIAPSINNIIDPSLGVTTMEVTLIFSEEMDQAVVPMVDFPVENASSSFAFNAALSQWTDAFTYVAVYDILDANVALNDVDIESVNAEDLAGNVQTASTNADVLQIDTQNPTVNTLVASDETVGDAQVPTGFDLTFIFSEPMDIFTDPTLVYPGGSPEAAITLDAQASGWLSPTQYRVIYSVQDNNEEYNNIVMQLSSAKDSKGNIQNPYNAIDQFEVDLKNPLVTAITFSENLVSDQNLGGITATIEFDDDMDPNTDGLLSFPNDDIAAAGLSFTSGLWTASDTYVVSLDVNDAGVEVDDIDALFDGAKDNAGNDLAVEFAVSNAFSVDTKNPQVVFVGTNNSNILAGDDGTSFTITAGFDEAMDESANPVISFPVENPTAVIAAGSSSWPGSTIYQQDYMVTNVQLILPNIDVQVANAKDLAGNLCVLNIEANLFDITTGVGVVEFTEANGLVVYPNPVDRGNEVIVQWQGDANNVGYVLYNVLGEKVMVQTATNQSGNNLHIQTDNLSTGMYMLQMEMDGQYKVINVQVIR